MDKKKEVSMKGIIDRKQVVTYLQDLMTSLKNGTIVVQQGEEFVSLNPEDLIFLEVEAEQKKDKEKLIFELSWRKEQEANEEVDFRITSKEPENSSNPS